VPVAMEIILFLFRKGKTQMHRYDTEFEKSFSCPYCSKEYSGKYMNLMRNKADILYMQCERCKKVFQINICGRFSSKSGKLKFSNMFL
jgi:transcription elongation factor Elf1